MANENTRFIRAGRYGTKSTSYPRVTGNGTKSTPHNIETLDWQGNLVLAGGVTCGGGISCAGNIQTSNGDIAATGDCTVGGRFDAGGGGSFGGNLGVTGYMSAASGTFTSRVDVGYGGIISEGDIYSRDIHIAGDVRATGRIYDEDGLINVSKNYVNDIRIAKYYNSQSPGVPFAIFGVANFTLFTQYEIPAIGTDYLAGVCEALVRLGFYSNTPIDEDSLPISNSVMPAFGYSRRGRSNVSKIVAGLYCSNYSESNPDDNTLEVLCYDVVNSVYSTETWKSRLQQEPGFDLGSHTVAIVNAYQALEPVPEPEPTP